MANIYKEITELYGSANSYFSRYMGDVLITIVVCLIVFVIVSYFQVMNNLQPIIDDWNNQKCSPSVIPFAGIINNTSGESNFDFTASNFENCTQNILAEIANYAFQPIYYLMNSVTSVFSDLAEAMNSMRSMFDSMRDSIKGKGEEIFSRNLNVMLPIVSMFIGLKSVLGKVQATFVSAIYTAYGGFITLESFFFFLYGLLIDIIWGIIAALLVLFAIAWFFPPALVTIGLTTVAGLAVVGVTAYILTIVNNIFGAAGLDTPPAIPGYCFDENTRIKLKNNSKKLIKNIKLGDVLWDGSLVTSVMKCSSRNCDIYKINGVIVTGTHMIYGPVKGAIRVKEHPESEYIDDYNKSFLYCLGTNTKTIKINDMIFADWDEIDEQDMDYIRNNCDFIPYDFSKDDIHTYLEGGLHEDTLIALEDGRSVKIKDVEVNDILYTGDFITAIVKINSKDTERFCNIEIDGEKVISCSKNVEIDFNILGSDLEIIAETIDPPEVSYHLITNSGSFKVGDMIIGDYNTCLDKYLGENKSDYSMEQV